MKVRLIGPAREMTTWVDLLRSIANVRRVSKFHAEGGMEVRVYVHADLFGEAQDPDATAPRCPWCRLPHILDRHGPVMGGMSWSCRRCRRLFVHAEGGVFLAPAEDVASVQPGDRVLLPAGWRVALDVRVTGEHVEIRTDVPTDPLTGFRLPRVLTRREVKPWHDGSTYIHRVHVVRDGQQGEDL